MTIQPTKSNKAEAHSTGPSSQDSVLKTDGLKTNNNTIMTETKSMPNILNRSNGTPLLSSSINLGFAKPNELLIIARIDANIIKLRNE